MKQLMTYILCCIALAGCNSDEMRMHDEIDAYLKQKSVMVEEVSILSVEPMNKKKYLNTVMGETFRDVEPLAYMRYTENGVIPESKTREVDSLADIEDAKQKEWQMMKNRITEKRDRDDFAFSVITKCICTGRNGSSKQAQIEFIYCKHKDLGLTMIGGEKWLKQWSR